MPWRGSDHLEDKGGRQKGGVDTPHRRRRPRAEGVVRQALVGDQRARQGVLDAHAGRRAEADGDGRQAVAQRDAAQLPHAEAELIGAESLEVEGEVAADGGPEEQGEEPSIGEKALAVVRKQRKHFLPDALRPVAFHFREEAPLLHRAVVLLLVVRHHFLQADAGPTRLAAPLSVAAGHLRIDCMRTAERQKVQQG